MQESAIILFSGGLDSTTCLAYAISKKFSCYALSFDYGQRQTAELIAAKRTAAAMGVKHEIFNLGINQFIKGSALTDKEIAIPEGKTTPGEIPVTYVPARNTIFLSIALAWAEVVNAKHIFIGVSAVDYSNYPDCRPDFIAAFQQVANLGTRFGIQEGGIKIHTPLIALSKAETIQLGLSLGVDYSKTVSCYQADAEGRACGLCASCRLRIKGFQEAGMADPTRYR